MAGNSDVKELVKELKEAIEDGVELFKVYKEISEDFQKLQKKLMNNEELKKISANLKQKYDEEKIAKRRDILKRRQNKKLSDSDIKLSNSLNSELETKEKDLNNKYEKELKKRKEAHEKLSEIYLVNSDKKFLKEKEKIREEKKRILSRIKIALSDLKNTNEAAFKKIIKDIYKSTYPVSDKKQITFKKLLNHLESGQVSENVAKTTKKIDELMTIGNVVNRKKKMEIGIKQKEIQKLLENYEKTNKLSKESVKKEITNLVKSLNRITNAKKKEEVTTKIDRLSRSLKNEMTERERKIKYDIQIKMQELKKLQAS